MKVIQVVVCALFFQASYQRQLRERIFDGTDISIKDAPYVVQMGRGNAHPTWGPCTGALISNRIVITARHCLCKGPRTILVGGDKMGEGKVISFPVSKKTEIRHPKVDMGIIILPDPIEFSDTVNKIDLPSWADAKLNITGEQAFYAGWGNTGDEKGKEVDTKTLKGAYVTISNVTSEWIYYEHDEREISTPWSCRGDSGSPLVINNKLFGVLSGSDPRDRKNGTNYFAAVHKQLKWISKHTGIQIQNV